jgi:hypothetical protein
MRPIAEQFNAKAENDWCRTQHERSDGRVSGATASLQGSLFVHEGLNPTNRLASDNHQLS